MTAPTIESKEIVPPRLFVSYSWDDQEHQNWVLQLARRLRGDGIDVVLDVWDLQLGADLAYFMEHAGDLNYRVLAVVSDNYRRKADDGEGGVGYEKRIITATIMADLQSARVIPLLHNNDAQQLPLPRFMGSTKYIDFRRNEDYETKYLELLMNLHGIESSPRPRLGQNPFTASTVDEVSIALRHDPARYAMPALAGTVTFDYTNNNGKYRIGDGDRSFTVSFSEAGHGSIYVLNNPSDITTVALAPNVTTPHEVDDASRYDGSSRVRHIRVGDAAILRNRYDHWAVLLLDEVLTRESSPDNEPRVEFRFHITPTPSPVFSSSFI